MEEVDLKELFKLDRYKILLAIIIFLVWPSTIHFNTGVEICTASIPPFCSDVDYISTFFAFPSLIFFLITNFDKFKINIGIGSLKYLWFLVLSYFISCLINLMLHSTISTYKKYKKRRK